MDEQSRVEVESQVSPDSCVTCGKPRGSPLMCFEVLPSPTYTASCAGIRLSKHNNVSEIP